MLRRILRAAFGRRASPAPPPSVRNDTFEDVSREPVPASYRLGRPHLADWPDDAFDPAFLAASRDGSETALRSVLREVHPHVYALTPLSERRITDLRDEIGRFHAWCLASGTRVEPPNSMNTYGAALDALGLDASSLRAALAPFARLLFTPMGGSDIDDVHGFVVSYARARDVDLGFHADDAEVTLNLCLGADFTGGDLYFEGLRCEGHRQTGCSDADRFVWAHRPGTALLHAGWHRHGALPITGGTRHNLILWLRSAAWRAQAHEDCPDWCRESMAR
jgi:hypothetical protein